MSLIHLLVAFATLSGLASRDYRTRERAQHQLAAIPHAAVAALPATADPEVSARLHRDWTARLEQHRSDLVPRISQSILASLATWDPAQSVLPGDVSFLAHWTYDIAREVEAQAHLLRLPISTGAYYWLGAIESKEMFPYCGQIPDIQIYPWNDLDYLHALLKELKGGLSFLPK